MPRPAYLIAASSGAIDEQSNRASFFNVFETLQGDLAADNSDQPSRELAPSELRLMIVAAWMREEGDRPDDVFEVVLLCQAADGEPIFAVPPSTFSFERPYHRLVVHETSLTGLPKLGLYTIQAQIRRVGEQEWGQTMTFPFLVQDRAAVLRIDNPPPPAVP